MKILDYEGLKIFAGKIKTKIAEVNNKKVDKGKLAAEKLKTDKKSIATFTDHSTADTRLDIILGDLELRTEYNRDKKVDKVQGKGLSSNDFTDAAKAKVDEIPQNPKYTDTIQDLSGYAKKSEINNKVDKDGGKVLSDNNYTNADKTKVASLPTDANWVVPIINCFAGVAKFTNDLNTLTKAGIYSCRSNSNRPAGSGNYATCIVTKADSTVDSSGTDTIQMWIDQSNGLFIRNNIDKDNSSWTDWVQIGGSNSGEIQISKIGQTITLEKKDGVVYVSGELTRTAISSGIPYGFRPIRSRTIEIFNKRGNISPIEFRPDGVINDRMENFNDTICSVCFSYLTND